MAPLGEEHELVSRRQLGKRFSDTGQQVDLLQQDLIDESQNRFDVVIGDVPLAKPLVAELQAMAKTR